MTFVDGSARPSTVTLWDAKFQRLWDRVTSACSGWAGVCWPQPLLLQGLQWGSFPLVVLSGLWTRNTNCALAGGFKTCHWLSLSIALCSLLGRYWDDFSNGFETTNQLPRWLLHPWPSTLRTHGLVCPMPGRSGACGKHGDVEERRGEPEPLVLLYIEVVMMIVDYMDGNIVHIVHYHHHHWNIQWNQSIRDCWCLAMPFSGRWRRSSCALSILGRDGRKLLPRWLSGRSINYSEVTLGEVSHHIPLSFQIVTYDTTKYYESLSEFPQFAIFSY